ncbi:type I toxin-antitoxin system toxin Ldr family protein [uncultured Escherichia sp.]
MTLAQFAMTFWHDLAAVMAICARNRPQG